jgi:3-hydroxyisobutyrate dehydrogenase
MEKIRTVAVLGTGTMGAPMARNLAEAGFEVRAWNPTRAKAEGIDDVAACESPAAAVDGADVVLTMAPDGDAVEETMFGDDGAVGALREGAVWIQSATVGVAAAERLGELAAEHGIAYVDAPVLGTKQPAEKGELVVLASGPDDALDRCAPVFDAYAQKTLRLGDAGNGSRLKLVVNTWLLSLVEGAAESIALAQALGVDPREFLAAVEGGSVDSPYLQLKGKAMIEQQFEPSFTLEHAHKDVELVLEAARGAGLELALAEAIDTKFERALELGHGDEDMSATWYATAERS